MYWYRTHKFKSCYFLLLSLISSSNKNNNIITHFIMPFVRVSALNICCNGLKSFTVFLQVFADIYYLSFVCFYVKISTIIKEIYENDGERHFYTILLIFSLIRHVRYKMWKYLNANHMFGITLYNQYYTTKCRKLYDVIFAKMCTSTIRKKYF